MNKTITYTKTTEIEIKESDITFEYLCAVVNDADRYDGRADVSTDAYYYIEETADNLTSQIAENYRISDKVSIYDMVYKVINEWVTENSAMLTAILTKMHDPRK